MNIKQLTDPVVSRRRIQGHDGRTAYRTPGGPDGIRPVHDEGLADAKPLIACFTASVDSNMIDRDHYQLIRRKHGGYASWAVWTPAAATPTSNVGDLSLFDVIAHPATLQVLRPDVIMVGLNISRSFCQRFRNFHDPRPQSKDFKLRYAFAGTRWYGAYMTDIIKNLESVESTSVRKRLRLDPSLVRASVEIFRGELSDLRTWRPVILAFGRDAYAQVRKALPESECSVVVRLTHYSDYIGKEDYRAKVLRQIDDAIGHRA